MAATKAAAALFAAGTNVPAGTTKAAPVIGNTIDCRAGYGGLIDWRITNGGALGVVCTIMFQTSLDGSNWFDYQPVSSGDLLSATVTQGPSIFLTRAAMYVRPIAYGNTTSACTVEAVLEQVTGL
jgi:hypothetical protein